MEEQIKFPRRKQIHFSKGVYSQPGEYFVTVCTQERVGLFGAIVDSKMILNSAGKMVEEVWENLPQHFSGVLLDRYQIMPNHIHGIIVISASVESTVNLIDVVNKFKFISTNMYISGVKQYNWSRFPGKLWQRSFYDRIIRDDEELDNIREYIENNPKNWGIDRDNLDREDLANEER